VDITIGNGRVARVGNHVWEAFTCVRQAREITSFDGERVMLNDSIYVPAHYVFETEAEASRYKTEADLAYAEAMLSETERALEAAREEVARLRALLGKAV
jgi:hypothetical protein